VHKHVGGIFMKRKDLMVELLFGKIMKK